MAADSQTPSTVLASPLCLSGRETRIVSGITLQQSAPEALKKETMTTVSPSIGFGEKRWGGLTLTTNYGPEPSDHNPALTGLRKMRLKL
jgi:hypothetical protein